MNVFITTEIGSASKGSTLSPWGHLSPHTVFETICVFWTNGSFSCLAIYSKSLKPSPRGAGGTDYRSWTHLDLVLAPGQPWAHYSVCLRLKSLVWHSTRAQNNYLTNHLLQRDCEIYKVGRRTGLQGWVPVTCHILVEGTTMFFLPGSQWYDSVKEVKATQHSSQSGQDPGLGHDANGERGCSATLEGNVNQEGRVVLNISK